MAETGDTATETLSALRARIDAVDTELHRLLIERGSVIDDLIAAKGTNASGVAFRPQREAEMIRRLAARHQGHLPLAAVEHLWREIITTFTFMQAPFRLIVHYGNDPVAIHDLARFAFGFSVELVRAQDPADAVATVAKTGADLGLIPLEDSRFDAPWWRSLSMAAGPRIMALWPFIAGKGLPADAPAVIVSPPIAEPAPSDIAVYAATDDRPLGESIPTATLLAESSAGAGREVLIARRRDDAPPNVDQTGARDIVEVGGFAAGLTLTGGGSDLRSALRASSP